MSIAVCIIIPVVLMVCILMICKWLNFTIIPKDMQLKSKQKFKMPKMRRKYGNNKYEWEYLGDEDDEYTNNSDSDEEDERMYQEKYQSGNMYD